MAEFCLIGERLGHSFSKLIHEKMGYSYDLVEVPLDELKSFVDKKEYKAYNVTIPYKQVIMPMLDVIDDSAKAVGSVNTVINRQGKLYGYNTDIYGMKYAFDCANIRVENKKVLILGSGGTCATALALAKQLKAKEIVKVSRSGENNYKNIYKHYDAQVIINTTPVGMFPKCSDRILDISKFESLEGVFDAIYNPLATNLILDANEKIENVSNGLMMLVAQAKYARDLFVGNVVVDSIINDIYNSIVRDKNNIVLIGMPSCGKSSVGSALANALNKQFLDTDSEICKKTGMSIPDIFTKYGEEYFRKLEAEIVGECYMKQGLVIATGGGIVLNKDNIHKLKMNGKIVYLKRDLNRLVSDGRPLSKDAKAIETLYKQRKDLYEGYSTIKIDGNGSISETVKDLIFKLNY